MTENIEIRSYGRDNYLSVWVGKCDTEQQFYDYIKAQYDEDGDFFFELGGDFGIYSYDEDFSLVKFCETATADLEILLDTGAPDYVTRAFSAQNRRFLDKEYNVCVMFYDMDYSGAVTEIVNLRFGEFRFLGSVQSDKMDMLKKSVLRLDVSELNRLAHDFEEDSFERFDEIYADVMDGYTTVEIDDIPQLCAIFAEPFSEIHPHQYRKIHNIIYTAIEKRAVSGFTLLIEGILSIPEVHAVDLLGMVRCNSGYLPDFEKALSQFDSEKQAIVKKYTEKR